MTETALRRSARTYAEGQVLSADDIIDVLDGFQIQPDAIFEWNLTYDEDEHTLEITSWSHDSRAHDFDSEYGPDGLGKANQTVTMALPGRVTETVLVRTVYQGLAIKAAHEIMEWTRYQGEMLYDPHVEGDPSIVLPIIRVRTA